MQNTSNDVAVVVIPARYGSTRLPGKPLADLGGRPLIEHVWRRSRMAALPSRVLVATDDERIRAALPADCEVVMTRADHPSGSDRIAEVAENLDCGIVVNVQGDLPLLDPTLVDELIDMLRADPKIGLATVAVPIESAEEYANPSVVKVVCSTAGHALYFSRSPIPHDRSNPGSFGLAMRHVGIYAYRRETLLAFAKMTPTPLELTETLEQLRALENGIGIGVVRRAHGVPIEVDTPEDLAAVRKVLSASSQAHTTGAARSAEEVRSS